MNRFAFPALSSDTHAQVARKGDLVLRGGNAENRSHHGTWRHYAQIVVSCQKLERQGVIVMHRLRCGVDCGPE
jgi:hypothetical protein